jgi:HD superfamily phosphohydrolase
MDKSVRYKIFADPIHGFISVPKGLLLQLLDHPYVQRLRRIRQLGLGYMVFPGAEHSRFSHALGALGLMDRVLANLKDQDVTITSAEYEATLAAILLHDIGHGPFSHTLEHTLIADFHHEMMTHALMQRLNVHFDGKLEKAIAVFTHQHNKVFLSQLVSSQLDIDRIDYLKRDSVLTGVSEGGIGIDRLLKTMRVHQNQIVLQRKGIYALENYIMARRLMYMQVYLHKTVLAADHVLRSIFSRVRHNHSSGVSPSFEAPALSFFLKNRLSAKDGIHGEMLEQYVRLDDSDIITSIKYWRYETDPVLSDLCRRFLDRDLGRTVFLSGPPSDELKEAIRKETVRWLQKRGLPDDDVTVSSYLHFGSSYTEAYKYQKDSIFILDELKNKVEFSVAADTRHIVALTEPVVKHYVITPKDIRVKI